MATARIRLQRQGTTGQTDGVDRQADGQTERQAGGASNQIQKAHAMDTVSTVQIKNSFHEQLHPIETNQTDDNTPIPNSALATHLSHASYRSSRHINNNISNFHSLRWIASHRHLGSMTVTPSIPYRLIECWILYLADFEHTHFERSFQEHPTLSHILLLQAVWVNRCIVHSWDQLSIHWTYWNPISCKNWGMASLVVNSMQLRTKMVGDLTPVSAGP